MRHDRNRTTTRATMSASSSRDSEGGIPSADKSSPGDHRSHRQHHGTSRVIFTKRREDSSSLPAQRRKDRPSTTGMPEVARELRYGGPKQQTRESAIVSSPIHRERRALPRSRDSAQDRAAITAFSAAVDDGRSTNANSLPRLEVVAQLSAHAQQHSTPRAYPTTRHENRRVPSHQRHPAAEASARRVGIFDAPRTRKMPGFSPIYARGRSRRGPRQGQTKGNTRRFGSHTCRDSK